MSRPRACVLVLFLLAGCENSGPLEINATSRAPVPPRVVPYEAIDLGDLGGDPTIPFAVNESLDVAGGATLAEGTPHAFRWQQGALADLGTVAGGTSEAHAINNRGQVAGASGGYLSGRVFLWDHGTMQDLGPGNAFYVIVRGINDQGDVLATAT